MMKMPQNEWAKRFSPLCVEQPLMCLGFEITCIKYPHSFSHHKKSSGSLHICFPSLMIPGEALFVQHITGLLCCNCLVFAKGHSSFILLPTHLRICGGETNMLSCCFPSLPFFWETQFCCGFAPFLPAAMGLCLCERDGISWHQMAAIQTMIPLLWALLFTKVDCWGMLLYLPFFISLIPPPCYAHHLHTNSFLLFSALGDGQ